MMKQMIQVGIAFVSCGWSLPLHSEEPVAVESLVRPPREQVAEPPSGERIPLEIQKKLEAAAAVEAAEERRSIEESRTVLKARRAEEKAEFDARAAAFRVAHEQAKERTSALIAQTESRIEETSQSLAGQMMKTQAESDRIRGQWDAESAQDQRDFHAQYQAASRQGQAMLEIGAAMLTGGMGSAEGLAAIGLKAAGSAAAGALAEGGDSGAALADSSAAGPSGETIAQAAGLASRRNESLPFDDSSDERVRRIAGIVGDTQVLRDVAHRDVQSCQPVAGDPPSLDVRILKLLGYTDRSPCGGSRDASKLPLGCFPPGSQDFACAKHDRALKDCDAPWNELGNACVYRAHRDLANNSTDRKLGIFFRVMSWFSPHHPPLGKLEDFHRTGIPIYPASEGMP